MIAIQCEKCFDINLCGRDVKALCMYIYKRTFPNGAPPNTHRFLIKHFSFICALNRFNFVHFTFIVQMTSSPFIIFHLVFLARIYNIFPLFFKRSLFSLQRHDRTSHIKYVFTFEARNILGCALMESYVM